MASWVGARGDGRNDTPGIRARGGTSRGLPRERLGHLPRSLEDQGHLDPGSTQHFEQGVHAEPIDPSPGEVADPRLGDAQEFGRRVLGEPLGLDQLRQANHEIGAKAKVLGLSRRESEFPKHVGRSSGEREQS